ncbi:SHOCT domain-containing protein [Streptomyces sp. UNOC14_S4]
MAERFARGEIDEEEYRSRLAALRSSGPGPGAPPPP